MDHLGSIVPSAVRRLLSQGEMSPGKLQFAWGVAVGPAIERATTVRLTPNGILEVAATDPAWRRELRAAQGTILRKVQDLLGPAAVKRIRVLGYAGGRD